MKKFLFLWFLLVTFFFFPQNIKAETLDTLDCTYSNSSRPVEEIYRCSGLSSSYGEYNEITGTYDLTLKDWTNSYFYVPRAHIFDVEIGPPTLKSGYVFGLSNSGLSNYSYYYNFLKDNIYSLNYTLTVPKGFDLYLNKKYSLLSFSGRITGEDTLTNDVIDNAITLGSFKEDVNSDTTDTYSFSIEFQPKYDLDRLQFYLGFDTTSSDFDVTSDYLFKNDVDNSYKVYVSDFSVTQIDDFSEVIHGGGGISLDKPSKDDESIFSNLKTCDALDIGCHVDNILTMIKNVFVRIGNFFVSIWEAIVSIVEFFADFFTVLGQVFIEIVTDIIIPDSDYLSTRFNAFSKFLSDKLGLISFPFELTAHFLNRFLDIPNTPIKTITVPTISIGSFGTLIPGFTFNIAEYWEKAPFNQIYNIYLIFVHCFIVFCLYRLCVKKFNEIVGGCSM